MPMDPEEKALLIGIYNLIAAIGEKLVCGEKLPGCVLVTRVADDENMLHVHGWPELPGEETVKWVNPHADSVPTSAAQAKEQQMTLPPL